jgi:hypothetical protein
MYSSSNMLIVDFDRSASEHLCCLNLNKREHCALFSKKRNMVKHDLININLVYPNREWGVTQKELYIYSKSGDSLRLMAMQTFIAFIAPSVLLILNF